MHVGRDLLEDREMEGKLDPHIPQQSELVHEAVIVAKLVDLCWRYCLPKHGWQTK